MLEKNQFKLCIFCKQGYSDQYATVREMRGTRYIYFHSECYEKYRKGNLQYSELERRDD